MKTDSTRGAKVGLAFKAINGVAHGILLTIIILYINLNKTLDLVVDYHLREFLASLLSM